MKIELGNASPVLPPGETRDAPCVTYVNVPDDPDNFDDGHHAYRQVEGSGLTGAQLKDHLADTLLLGDGITRLEGHEPVLVVAHPFGAWNAHATSGTKPLWVWSDNKETERILAEYYECPAGRPADVETTHFTSHFGQTFAPGDAPVEGVPYNSIPDVQANITQNGRDMQASVFGTKTAVAGTATTAPGATTVTLDGVGAPGSTSAYNGQVIFMSGVWGLAISNTNAAPPVVTIDRWYNPATPGGAAASTPAAGKFVVAQVTAAVQFMGLSANTTALASPSTNTSLPGEITTGGGGLIRQICPIAHTASTAVTTLTPVFTANGSDSLPVTIGSVGTFSSMVVADVTFTMFFNTLLGTTATLSSIGDQLTITQTVTST